MNDFVGIGYGLLALKPAELETVHAGNGKPDAKGVKAVIGAGTGLGECFLTFNGKEFDVFPAEGGHADFAPRNQTEFELMQYVLATAKDEGKPVDRVSVERVTSGTGLRTIYNFLSSKQPGKAHPGIAEKIRSADEGEEERRGDAILSARVGWLTCVRSVPVCVCDSGSTRPTSVS